MTIDELKARFKGYHLEINIVPSFTEIAASGCEECGTNDAVYEVVNTRNMTIEQACQALEQKLSQAGG